VLGKEREKKTLRVKNPGKKDGKLNNRALAEAAKTSCKKICKKKKKGGDPAQRKKRREQIQAAQKKNFAREKKSPPDTRDFPC